ncbi:LysR family transcriptional regulator [Tritonibacter mobilis]|uniref:LysR family transcriptional regulator n=1 Tax=Tritonibacter mobilis TaxID=379347 RepID=UPI000806F06E|nr:LysR family transcriptional regulator [Tritonibacter mobilis]GLP88312.1 LysR family transcriptional regulator [Tritonibacter mobilis]
MKIRFRQLQAFHAIVETGTVTGAAGLLGISQPGVSNLLSQLEDQAGLPLFERLHGRLLPTPEAELLFAEVDTVMRGMSKVTQTMVDLKTRKLGQLQIASQHAMSFGFMPRLIARFAADRPELNISFQSQYSSKVQEWVWNGLFEIGVCEMPLLYDTLTVYPLYVETMLALHKDNPLVRHEVLTPELLAGEPFIVMGQDHMTHRRLREAFQNAGVPLRTRVHSHLFKNLLSFVQEGMGVALLDRFMLDYDMQGDVITRPFRPTIMMDMCVITSKSRPMSQLGKEFLDLLLHELQHYTVDARPLRQADRTRR